VSTRVLWNGQVQKKRSGIYAEAEDDLFYDRGARGRSEGHVVNPTNRDRTNGLEPLERHSFLVKRIDPKTGMLSYSITPRRVVPIGCLQWCPRRMGGCQRPLAQNAMVRTATICIFFLYNCLLPDTRRPDGRT